MSMLVVLVVCWGTVQCGGKDADVVYLTLDFRVASSRVSLEKKHATKGKQTKGRRWAVQCGHGIGEMGRSERGGFPQQVLAASRPLCNGHHPQLHSVGSQLWVFIASRTFTLPTPYRHASSYATLYQAIHTSAADVYIYIYIYIYTMRCKDAHWLH